MMGSVVGIRGQRGAGGSGSGAGPLLQFPKSFQPRRWLAGWLACWLAGWLGLVNFFYRRSRAQEIKQQPLPEFYLSGM